MSFTISGDPSIGGLVEDASGVDIGDAREPDLIEGVRETMYPLSFDPPEGGGSVRVTYPFNLARTEQAADHGDPPREQR